MIAFVTAHDEATTSNLGAVAPRLPADALVGDDATSSALLSSLRTRSAARLVAFSHGDHAGLVAQDGTPALPLDEVALVGSRSAFAYACHTGSVFGRRARDLGWTWWGYTGAVCAPGDGGVEREIVGKVMWAVVAVFMESSDPDQIGGALDRIRLLCEASTDELDADPGASCASYLCVLHLRDRLRVWHPAVPGPLYPPRCSEPILLP